MGYEVGLSRQNPMDDDASDIWYWCGREFSDVFYALKDLKIRAIDDDTVALRICDLSHLIALFESIRENVDCVSYVSSYSVDPELSEWWFSYLNMDRKIGMCCAFDIACASEYHRQLTSVLWKAFERNPLSVWTLLDEVFSLSNELGLDSTTEIYLWQSY